MTQKTYLFCCGSPAEIVQMFPLHRLLNEEGEHASALLVGTPTAEMAFLQQFFQMPSAWTIAAEARAHAKAWRGQAIAEVDAMLREIRPDTLVVAGGSPSALAGALAGYVCNIPIAHLDAGVRTFAENPSLDEKNQELIARLAHWHFTATEQARCNLLEEKIPPSRIFEVGSTLIDAAIWTREHLRAATNSMTYSMPDALREFLFQCRSRRLIVVVSDEARQDDRELSCLGNAIAVAVEQHPEARVVWLTSEERRSATAKVLQDMSTANRASIFHHDIPPFPMQIDILARCSFVIAESREIQQIASAFGKPVLIPTKHSVGHDLIKAGGAIVAAIDTMALSEQIEKLLQDPVLLKSLQLQVSPFGDGNAASRIGEIVSIIK